MEVGEFGGEVGPEGIGEPEEVVADPEGVLTHSGVGIPGAVPPSVGSFGPAGPAGLGWGWTAEPPSG